MYGLIDTRSSSIYLVMGTIEVAPMYKDLSILKMKEQQSQASLVTGPCVTYNQICLHFPCSLALLDIFWINIGVHFVEIKNAIIKTSINAPISGSFHEAEGT